MRGLIVKGAITDCDNEISLDTELPGGNGTLKITVEIRDGKLVTLPYIFISEGMNQNKEGKEEWQIPLPLQQ